MTTRELLTTCWAIDPLAIAACVTATVAYVVVVGPRRPRTRAAFFALAIVAVLLALCSPIGQLANGYLFSAHMLQHLLLVLAVPALLLLSVTQVESGVAAPRSGLFPPVIAWAFGVGAMWLWHAPTLCNAAAALPAIHRLQELTLLGMGTVFWWPILAPRPAARLAPLGGILYLFTACVACTLLGVLVTFSPVEVCSVFSHPQDALGVMPLLREGWGLTVQKDQQIGGLLMWVPACVVYGAAILGTLSRLYRADTDTESTPLAKEAS
jgi:putative membrane protein